MNTKASQLMLVGIATTKAADATANWVTCSEKCSSADLALTEQLNEKYNQRLSESRLQHEIKFYSQDVVKSFVDTIKTLHADADEAQARDYALWFVSKGKRSDDINLLGESKGLEMDFDKLDDKDQFRLMKELDCSFHECISAFYGLKWDLLNDIDIAHKKV